MLGVYHLYYCTHGTQQVLVVTISAMNVVGSVIYCLHTLEDHSQEPVALDTASIVI